VERSDRGAPVSKAYLFGRAIFATAIAGLGVQCLLRGNAVPVLEPVSSSSLPLIGWITGLVLVAAALLTMLRPTSHYGAAMIAAMLLLWVLLLHAPALASAPTNGGEWTGALETFALSGAAIVLFGLTRGAAGYEREPDQLARRASTIGRILYGVSMPGFGVLHFIYVAYTASVIPDWIPAHDFFAYAMGVAHIASGLSLLTGVLSRLAARLTAAMFGSWVIILHVPRMLAHPDKPGEWTSMLIATSMCGGALLIASALSNIPSASESLADSPSEVSRPTVLA